MNKILEKIKLYEEKNKLIKLKEINDFLSLSENDKKDYIYIDDINEMAGIYKTFSGINLITNMGLLSYTLFTDDGLKCVILNYLNSGSLPIVEHFNSTQLYEYLIIMSFISLLAYSKISDIYEEINSEKKILEEQEPKLKGYKYIKK